MAQMLSALAIGGIIALMERSRDSHAMILGRASALKSRLTLLMAEHLAVHRVLRMSGDFARRIMMMLIQQKKIAMQTSIVIGRLSGTLEARFQMGLFRYACLNILLVMTLLQIQQQKRHSRLK